jgi:putative protease
LAFRDTHDVPELLAPAGGPEPFRAALAAGADAIFCGLGSDFNARRGAGNFTYETFAQACREAHLLGARVYVTQNVVIKGDEMPRALALLRKAWLLGADAFIIQDWGLLAEARRLWPEIECHISTQANVHDARATRWCGELGAERVTLSRELSVAEIERIAREGVELESFGHGALCFCYSGVCMMSSLSGGRSANRGLCAQPCRLPYDLVDGDGNVISAPGAGRPLCPKDFRTLDDLPRLTAAGLGSLKVEGRMKAPDYVYSVISAYRAQLDDLAAGREVTDADEAARSRTLARAFNRDFTNSYLDGPLGQRHDELRPLEQPRRAGGHRGGDARPWQREGAPRRREWWARPLPHRDDGGGGRAPGRARGRRRPSGGAPAGRPVAVSDDPRGGGRRAGDVICCKTARPMPRGCPVRVIRSKRAMDEAARAASGEKRRRLPVRVAVTARLGRPFAVTLTTAAPLPQGAASACAEGFVVEPARTRAVTREDLVEHVGRMGTSPFEPVAFDVDMDEGAGMGFSAVHKVRAQACDLLEQGHTCAHERGRTQAGAGGCAGRRRACGRA